MGSSAFVVSAVESVETSKIILTHVRNVVLCWLEMILVAADYDD